ncbi:hypothetical protein GBAR_LOCUS23539 [Geodia barretti]|uniref:Uncharacterized protein n=1 Tax=Geodia barretti TaxID=519541 RepID=A0AA35T6U3_GEOBA|nr:hypothetical protein GBAR_LOCUS23539 [Geodia barretti]
MSHCTKSVQLLSREWRCDHICVSRSEGRMSMSEMAMVSLVAPPVLGQEEGSRGLIEQLSDRESAPTLKGLHLSVSQRTEFGSEGETCIYINVMQCGKW